MDYIKCSVGDEFKFVGMRGESGCGTFNNNPKAVYIRIRDVGDEGMPTYDILDIDKKRLDYCLGCFTKKDKSHVLEKVHSISGIIPNIPKIMSDLSTAYKLARTPEPQKSFIKAGVTDQNGDFTNDGKLLFNAFLIEKFGAEFKETVVDPILAEQEKKS